MTTYSPKFNINQFELRGETGNFFDATQKGSVLSVTDRVPSQLDWLGQLLGWSGSNYWNSFNLTVDQKRQMLGGSFGIYNGFTFLEVVEVRNWSNLVVVKYNPHIAEGQLLFLGDYQYTPLSITQDGNNLLLQFEDLSDQFLSDLQAGDQLKALSPTAMPQPFVRDTVGISADRRFICDVANGTITLYPSYDTAKSLPYLYNTFFLGSRYYFNLPVKLIISDEYFIAPTYDFDSETWFIEIPCDLTEKNTELSARLDYEGSFIVISMSVWKDPSDWVTKDNAELFRGVWGNKGSRLPFHFIFDSLSLHGFDERQSLYLHSVERSIAFDTLLNFVYQQQTPTEPLPPPLTQKSQVWWNSQTGKFSLHLDDSFNCGPWIEKNYPSVQVQDIFPDFIFPDVATFRAYTGGYTEGDIVQIADTSGLDSSDNVLGILFPLSSPSQLSMFKPKGGEGWIALQFIFNNVSDFNADSLVVPPNVKVSILDSDGLSPSGPSYNVANLGVTVAGSYLTVLMKFGSSGDWFISPPSELKYIGNTRLFESSLDYSNPVGGEMVWDFANVNTSTRTAAIFYYNRWEYNSILSKWELKGDWVNVNNGSLAAPPPTVVEFNSVLVYCNNTLLLNGVSHLTDDFQISYNINPTSGEFEFTYLPRNYSGMVNLPEITISDSITTAFQHNVSDLVFSGLRYYMSPNVKDSETLLRVWKDLPLFCIESTSDYSRLNFPNALIADQNTGVSDSNWDRYFLRLPPSYQRNGSGWQKVNLTCQDFGYWGSPSLPEDMSCPAQESKPDIYEETYLFRKGVEQSGFVYSEPYLYSTYLPYFTFPGDYENANLLPTFDLPYDTFSEAEVNDYSPLHDRRANTSLPVGKGYGDWEGDYYRVNECEFLSGHLFNDVIAETLDPLPAPTWDSSIYKLPQTCLLDKESGVVDANHYKIGYAFFAADLSAAEEAFFDFSLQ